MTKIFLETPKRCWILTGMQGKVSLLVAVSICILIILHSADLNQSKNFGRKILDTRKIYKFQDSFRAVISFDSGQPKHNPMQNAC